jgi:hypothetical protein
MQCHSSASTHLLETSGAKRATSAVFGSLWYRLLLLLLLRPVSAGTGKSAGGNESKSASIA